MSDTTLITYTNYERSGLSYKAVIKYYHPTVRGTITLKLDFLSYWLIRWYHGKDVFLQMVSNRINELKISLEGYDF